MQYNVKNLYKVLNKKKPYKGYWDRFFKIPAFNTAFIKKLILRLIAGKKKSLWTFLGKIKS